MSGYKEYLNYRRQYYLHKRLMAGDFRVRDLHNLKYGQLKKRQKELRLRQHSSKSVVRVIDDQMGRDAVWALYLFLLIMIVWLLSLHFKIYFSLL